MPGKFSEGDVIQLKSGGPLMTIENAFEPVAGKQTYRCTWFDGKNELKRAEFKEEALEKYEGISIA
jgi:uncharacterized protein YodC (DUF2158 family)